MAHFVVNAEDFEAVSWVLECPNCNKSFEVTDNPNHEAEDIQCPYCDTLITIVQEVPCVIFCLDQTYPNLKLLCS